MYYVPQICSRENKLSRCWVRNDTHKEIASNRIIPTVLKTKLGTCTRPDFTCAAPHQSLLRPSTIQMWPLARLFLTDTQCMDRIDFVRNEVRTESPKRPVSKPSCARTLGLKII